MAQKNYIKGCSRQRPPLLEPNSLCCWKACFETYVKSKDIDLWQVIQNGDFHFKVKDEEIKLMNETPRHTPIITHQGNSQVKDCKIDILTQKYEKFSISNEETTDSSFTRFNAIVTSLKSLDPDYSSKNHVRKFLRALPLKWRAKVTTIEKAKDLSTLPFDEIIGNFKIYEMVLDNDGVGSKTTTKEKVKSLTLKAKVTREQTSDDSNSQDGSNKDGNRFEHGNQFGNDENRFGKGRKNKFGNKVNESLKPKRACYNYGIEGHFASECRKLEENKAFIKGARSDTKDDDEQLNDATCLLAIKSQEVVSTPSSPNIDLHIIDLKKENEKLIKFNKDFATTFEKL
nr:hypothetical protein [Tanacetum cinerariifolium]